MKKEGNSLKIVIVSGMFGILAAIFGAFVGRETHKINIKVGGESKNMEYKLIQEIVNKNEVTIHDLEDSLYLYRTKTHKISGDDRYQRKLF